LVALTSLAAGPAEQSASNPPVSNLVCQLRIESFETPKTGTALSASMPPVTARITRTRSASCAAGDNRRISMLGTSLTNP
jgi:hypothetical protein